MPETGRSACTLPGGFVPRRTIYLVLLFLYASPPTGASSTTGSSTTTSRGSRRPGST